MVGWGRSPKFLTCVLFLLLNLGLQLAFWMSFSYMSLPDSLEVNSREAAGQCSCPNPEPVTVPVGTCEPPQKLATPGIAVAGRGREEGGDGHEVKDGPHYLLVVIVLSSVRGRERRDAIRETWMAGYQEREPPILVRFAVGTVELSVADLEALKSEEAAHRDLLLLPNLKESYHNLTRKVLHSFVWADANLKFSYLMKCDDDTFLVLDTILKELAERTSTQENGFYWGFFDGRATPKKMGKWSESQWFLCDRYLPYALGGGYVLSENLVHNIAVTADSLQLYNSEDVSVGVWLAGFEAERKHDVRFNTEFVSRGCRNDYIVSHKQSVQDMHLKHQLLKAKGKQCEREYQTRASYEYNWNEPPSKCCERQRDRKSVV